MQNDHELRKMTRAFGYHASFVYFVDGGDLAKVGTTHNVLVRMVDLQGSSPVTLTLRYLVPGGRRLEGATHAVLAEHRRHGEWFDAVPALAYGAEVSRWALANPEDAVAYAREMEVYGGASMVPYAVERRRDNIASLYSRGVAVADIATEVGLTTSRVFQIIGELRKEGWDLPPRVMRYHAPTPRWHKATRDYTSETIDEMSRLDELVEAYEESRR